MNIRLNSSAPNGIYITKRESCFPELLGTQTVLTSNDTSLCNIGRGKYKNCPIFAKDVSDTQTSFFFLVIDLIAARKYCAFEEYSRTSHNNGKLLSSVHW